MTGIVDAVSFLGLGHVFTANMTGNVVLLGFAVAGASELSVARSSLSLVGFLAGAVFGGRLARVMINTTRRRWIFMAGALEAVLLLVAAVVSSGLESTEQIPSRRIYAVIVLTAVAMGLRTATVRQLAVLDMTTTVLTQTLAAFAAESTLAGGTNPRLGRRVAAVLLMFAGVWVILQNNVRRGIVRGVAHHRRHHQVADKPGDPHSPYLDDEPGFRSAVRGLWHAHLGWLLDKELRSDPLHYCPDVARDREAIEEEGVAEDGDDAQDKTRPQRPVESAFVHEWRNANLLLLPKAAVLPPGAQLP